MCGLCSSCYCPFYLFCRNHKRVHRKRSSNRLHISDTYRHNQPNHAEDISPFSAVEDDLKGVEVLFPAEVAFAASLFRTGGHLSSMPTAAPRKLYQGTRSRRGTRDFLDKQVYVSWFGQMNVCLGIKSVISSVLGCASPLRFFVSNEIMS